MEEKDITLLIIAVAILFILFKLYSKLSTERKKNKRLQKENKTLVSENKRLETEHLRFQLQPHTVNNILANLKVMADQLKKGMDSLSDILDYILYSNNDNMVTVEEELEFIYSYLSLHNSLLTELDTIQTDSTEVDNSSPHYSTPCIPRLISASLLENAFKHGDINHPGFLKIKLKLSDALFQIEVSNRIRQTINNSKGGIGLSNLKRRLEILMPESFEITSENTGETYHSTLSIKLGHGQN